MPTIAPVSPPKKAPNLQFEQMSALVTTASLMYRPFLDIVAFRAITRRSHSHANERVYWPLPSATAFCWIQRSLPLPGCERTALVSWQCLRLPANNEVDDDDEELFEYGHDNLDGDGAVNEAEVVVVEEDGEQGVADSDCNEREGDDDGDCEAFLAGVGRELGDGEEGSQG